MFDLGAAGFAAGNAPSDSRAGCPKSVGEAATV
jgi:hypothetical protein